MSSRDSDYTNFTLSDKNVVKYLILYRNKLDVTYNSNFNIDINLAGDTFELSQEVIALYASLDDTIARCNFKDKSKKLLDLLFMGYIIHDICNMDIGFKRSATYDLFDRMLDRIVKENNVMWKECMIERGMC